MILKKLTVEGFGKIRRIEASFDPRLAVISHPDFDEIAKAFGVVTKNRCLAADAAERDLSERTRICAEIELGGASYRVTAVGRPGGECLCRAEQTGGPPEACDFFAHIRQCAEEESLTRYCFRRRNAYAERLLRYMDADRYYPNGDFRRRTDGMGTTRTFRACLERFIREYEPEGVPCGAGVADLLPDGRFVECGAGGADRHRCAREEERSLFDYYCYLNVCEVWARFERVRDMHHESWPAVIDLPALPGGAERGSLLERARRLGRQLIVRENAERERPYDL